MPGRNGPWRKASGAKNKKTDNNRAKPSSFTKKKCHYCGKSGHIVSACFKKRDDERESRRDDKKSPKTQNQQQKCWNCGEKGHLKSNCKKAVLCYICEGTGHKSYECPKKDKKTGTGPAKKPHQKHGDGKHRKDDGANKGGKPRCCFECGKEGHIARDCTSEEKISKNERPFPQKCRLSKLHRLSRDVVKDWTSEELRLVKEFSRLSELKIVCYEQVARHKAMIQVHSEDSTVSYMHYDKIVNDRRVYVVGPDQGQIKLLNVKLTAWTYDRDGVDEKLDDVQRLLIDEVLSEGKKQRNAGSDLNIVNNDARAILRAEVGVDPARIRLQEIASWLRAMRNATMNLLKEAAQEAATKVIADYARRGAKERAKQMGQQALTDEDRARLQQAEEMIRKQEEERRRNIVPPMQGYQEYQADNLLRSNALDTANGVNQQ